VLVGIPILVFLAALIYWLETSKPPRRLDCEARIYQLRRYGPSYPDEIRNIAKTVEIQIRAILAWLGLK
jgi:hypothetical protein